MFDFLFGKKTKNNVQVLNPQDFAAKLKERKGVLIDVRSPQEFKAGLAMLSSLDPFWLRPMHGINKNPLIWSSK